MERIQYKQYLDDLLLLPEMDCINCEDYYIPLYSHIVRIQNFYDFFIAYCLEVSKVIPVSTKSKYHYVKRNIKKMKKFKGKYHLMFVGIIT